MGTGRIFINYRRDDSRADSGRIYDHLSARFPGKVFRDVGSLEPGVDWQQAIGRVISQCDACVVVIGCNWLNIKDEDGHRRLDDPRDTVRREVFAALQRDMRVFPVLVGGAKMPRINELPPDLQPLCDRNALEITEQEWLECCAKLTRALEIATGMPAPAPAPAPAPNPLVRKASATKWILAIASSAALLIAVLAISLSRKKVESPQPQPVIQSSIQPFSTPRPVAQPKQQPDPDNDDAAIQRVLPRKQLPAEVTSENYAGNWNAEVNSNGTYLNEMAELYRDHSFRVLLNGSSVAVGLWQTDSAGQLQLTNGTNFTTLLHFSCGTSPDTGAGGDLLGRCSDRMNNSWSFTLTRADGHPAEPYIPTRVDVSSLNMAERAAFLQVLSAQRCSCNCGMSVSMCLQKDLTCNFSPSIANNSLMLFLQTIRG